MHVCRGAAREQSECFGLFQFLEEDDLRVEEAEGEEGAQCPKKLKRHIRRARIPMQT